MSTETDQGQHKDKKQFDLRVLFIVLFVSSWIFVPRSSLPVLDRRSHFSLGVTDGITKKHEELEEHEGEVTKTEKQF